MQFWGYWCKENIKGLLKTDEDGLLNLEQGTQQKLSTKSFEWQPIQ